MHDLGGVLANGLSWAVIVLVLAVFAGLLLLLLGRRRSRAAARTVPRLDRAREWRLVVRRATHELARAPRVAELHASAAAKIEAAEYAYNRLVLDCAGLCDVPDRSAAEPAGALPREAQAPAPEHAPLAA